MRKRNWSQLVKKVLNKHLLSQAELAEICNVSQQTVSSWKIGTRIPGYLHRRKLLELFNDKDLGGQQKGLLDAEIPEIDVEIPADFEERFQKDPLATMQESFEKLSQAKKKEVAELARLKLMEDQLLDAYLKLKLKLEKKERLLSMLPDAAWCVEFDKNYIFKQVYMSPNLETITGYPESYFNLNDEKWSSIIHPDDREQYKSFSFNVVQNKLTDAVFDYRIINPDERVIKIRDKRKVTNIGDEIFSLCGIISFLM